MGYLRLLGLLVVTSFTSNLLTGCSSDSGSGVAPASYAGITTQASVTSENSEALTDAALDGASGGVGSNASATQGQTADKKQLLGLAHSLGSAIKGMDLSNQSGSRSMGAIQSDSGSVTSPCGGTLTYSYTFDDVTGEFTINSTFNEYVDCDDSSILSGAFKLNATGWAYDAYAQEYYYGSATMEFTTLTYKEGSESMTMTGSIAMSMSSATSYTMTMNFDYRDNVANETFRLENYVVTVTEDATGVNMSIVGNVYHPVHGYVSVTTLSTVRINFADGYPSAGQVDLDGASNSKVRVTFIDKDTYTLDIDSSDGGASFETTKTCTWSTDTCI